ncbi:MAG: geranylgeranyl reductase family protein [Candidatus Aenigmarchaeota archaeon]|nr:geranylgeranyl reductase family protein [Candidatus Aenigmarchaeota archaeon]
MAFDAIVVGGGPSGSTVSLMLSRKGHKVLLLDKAKFPRDKVCGDACSARGLVVIDELGLLSKTKRQPHVVVNRLLLSAPNGKRIIMPYAKDEKIGCAGYVIKRKKNDGVLFSAAKKEATVIEGFGVEELIYDNGSVVGVKGRDAKGRKKEFRAKVVVGADGANSVVARSVGSLQLDPKHRCGSIRGYFKGVTGLSDTIEIYFIDGVFPGYFWIFPMPGGLANVGLGLVSSEISKRGLSLNQMMEKAIASEGIRKRFKNAKQVGKTEGWIIPQGSKRVKNHGPGWILVGDAASLADPFSGEGFGNAMRSGKAAAEVIDAALKAGDTSEEFLSAYEKKIAEIMDEEFKSLYLIQKVSSHKFLLNLFLSKASSNKELRKVLADMMVSDSAKNQAMSPLFYLKLLFS